MMMRADLLESKLPRRIARWIPQLISAELCYGVDVYTLAAIIDRESNGGDALQPPGPGGKGDGGFGHGLGQIDLRTHNKFLMAQFSNGRPLWTDPTFNILYAAWLLHQNQRGADGNLSVAIAAYNCGLKRAKWALENKTKPGDTDEQRIAALDSVTTSTNYVSDILRRRAQFLKPTVA
jgi:hypothetical protein